MKVWVVMEQYVTDDDGDWATEIEAVHATKEGAEGNLTPDYAKTGHLSGTRERFIVEMDVLP